MTDIVIAGGGPAGIAAAVRARECGASVTIVDDNSVAGGQIWRGGTAIPSKWAHGVDFIGNARVVAGDAVRRTLLTERDGRAFEIAYGSLILATGSRELFLPFSGWTLPGIMGVGGLQA